MIDPYAELGIKKEASPEEVRRAYRRKARKTHPDAGGTAEEFAKVTKAHSVLINPLRRLNYDRTGKMDEDEPNDEQTKGLQIIAEVLDGILQEVENPETIDLVAEIKRNLKAGLTNIHNQLDGFRKQAEKFESLAIRFNRETGDNFLQRMLEQKARVFHSNIVAGEAKKAQVEWALKMLQEFTFDFDHPHFMFNTSTSTC